MVTCKWCEQPAIQSHIIPKSLHRTARSILRRDFDLRSIINPNLVVQDTSKPLLLCSGCDNSFSSFEHKFREVIYAPLLSGQNVFEYDDWLMSFAITIAWKRLVTGIPKLADVESKSLEQAEEALACWESFLLGKSKERGPYQHHIFLTQHIDKESVSDVVWKLITEVFESTVIPGKSGLWVWTAVPGCILISFAHRFDGLAWQCAADTQISLTGKFLPDQRIPAPVLLGWAEAAERDARKAVTQLSPRQLQKIKVFGDGTFHTIRRGDFAE